MESPEPFFGEHMTATVHSGNGLAPRRVSEVARELGIDTEISCLTGITSQKSRSRSTRRGKNRPDGNLILVTAK